MKQTLSRDNYAHRDCKELLRMIFTLLYILRKFSGPQYVITFFTHLSIILMMHFFRALFLATGLFACCEVFAQTAKVQVIHNCADPAAAKVDIYLNGQAVVPLNDFAFRTASVFVDLPAGMPITIGVAPGSSMSYADTLKTFKLTLESGKRYIAIAGGVINPANFAPNYDPNAQPLSFNLYPMEGQAAAKDADKVELLVFHGATDAPAVDVIVNRTSAPEPLKGLSFGENTGYIPLVPGKYVLGIALSGSTEALVEYEANISQYKGVAAVVVASGFLIPSSNQNGAAFGLFVATPFGGALVPLPQAKKEETAKVQIIHNSADPAAAKVDIYLNGQAVAPLNDFAFRTATEFIDLPAGMPITIGVAPGSSTSYADTLKTFTVTLEAGKNYLAIANGVIDPSKFSPNIDPKALPIGFNLYPFEGRTTSTTSTEANVFVYHGATDAPAVDILVNGEKTPPLSNISYGMATGYLPLGPAVYSLGVAPAGGNPLVTFSADLSQAAGKAMVVLASGFLNPAVNQNGAAFGLFVVTPAGGAFTPLTTGTVSVNEELATAQSLSIYPNPTSDKLTIGWNNGSALCQLINSEGNILSEQTITGNTTLDTQEVPNGLYIVRIQQGASTIHKQIIILK